GSVERGAVLRLLEEEAGLVPAQIRDIQRQRGEYKDAVQCLSEGATAEGFWRLERLGGIKEGPEAERYKQLAGDYPHTVEHGKTPLVVAPTHAEGRRITTEIRAKLRARGQLGADTRTLLRLENANLTAAERADAASYAPGDVLVFHQNAKGHARGDRVVV